MGSTQHIISDVQNNFDTPLIMRNELLNLSKTKMMNLKFFAVLSKGHCSPGVEPNQLKIPIGGNNLLIVILKDEES